MVAGATLAAMAGYALMSAVLGPHSSGVHERADVRHQPDRAPVPSSARRHHAIRAARPSDPAAAAVAAATGYVDALGEAPTQPAAGSQLATHTAQPLREQALHALVNERALASRLSRQGPAFLHGWLLGWRLDSFSPSRARVSVWAMGLVDAIGAVVSPDWSTTLCTLQQHDGQWEVVSALAASGPTPPPDGSDTGSVLSFARAALTFQPYTNATH